MPRKVVISRAALADLAAARDWLRQPGAGQRAAERLHKIRQAIRNLQQQPVSWPFGEHPAVRERPVEGYRIMYQVMPDTGDNATAGDIEILRVFGPYQNRREL